jgi:hypothetical protein
MRNQSLETIALIMGAISFLIAFAQFLRETPDTLLIQVIVIGQIVILLILLFVAINQATRGSKH